MKKLLLLLLVVTAVFGKWYKIKVPYLLTSVSITSGQIKNIQKVITYSKKYADGWHIALGAICLSESSAGVDLVGDVKQRKFVDITKASLGLLHIRVPTVRFLSTKFKKLSWLKHKSDYWIAQRLLASVKFQAMIAGYLMRFNQSISKHGAGEIITRYNGGKIPGHYYRKYKRNRILINKLIKLGLLHK